jgi:hypothetical protein
MSTLVTLDPSIRSAGVAVFQDGDLVAAKTFKEPRGRAGKFPEVGRCLDMAESVACWLLGRYRPYEYVTEWPQIYAPGKGKGNPSGLVGLAGVGTALAALLAYMPGLAPLEGSLQAWCYTPNQWCQGTSKPERGGFKTYLTSTRGVRILSRLSASERAVWDAQVKTHDAGDAVGIGLNHLGRLKPRRVYARE